MTTITLPTADQLAGKLGGIEKLLTAAKWERAAIVWAFTTKYRKPTYAYLSGKMPSLPMSIDDFAAMGFAGLTAWQTVQHYRKAWQEAIDQGAAQPVHPGDVIVLPDLPWVGGRDVGLYPKYPAKSKAQDLAYNAKAITEAIIAEPTGKVATAAKLALAVLNEEPATAGAKPLARPITVPVVDVQKTLVPAMAANEAAIAVIKKALADPSFLYVPGEQAVAEDVETSMDAAAEKMALTAELEIMKAVTNLKAAVRALDKVELGEIELSKDGKASLHAVAATAKVLVGQLLDVTR